MLIMQDKNEIFDRVLAICHFFSNISLYREMLTPWLLMKQHEVRKLARDWKGCSVQKLGQKFTWETNVRILFKPIAETQDSSNTFPLAKMHSSLKTSFVPNLDISS